MQVTQENDLIQSLQNMITTYMESRPQLTLNALAQRSNFPVTSLRRLMGGQQKNEIAPHSVLTLVSYVLREKNLSLLMMKAEPSVVEYLKKHFGSFVFTSEARVYSVDLNTELKDQTKYLIYKLAANHNGTDLMEVIDNFGSYGRKKVDEMIGAGLLIREGGRIHAKEKNFSLDLTVAAAHLPALVQFYKPATMAQGKNTFFSMSEALNEEAIQMVKQIQKESVLKIHAVINDPNNFGSIPYFTINLAETMLAETEQGDLQ